MLHTSDHFLEDLRAPRGDSSAVHCPTLPYAVGRLGARRSVLSACIARVLPHGCRVRPGPSSWLCYANLGSQSAMTPTSPLLPASQPRPPQARAKLRRCRRPGRAGRLPRGRSSLVVWVSPTLSWVIALRVWVWFGVLRLLPTF